jgi:putative transposase
VIRVQTFPCALPKADADALNRESGRIYSDMLVWHYRVYRRTGHWLSEYADKRLEDELGEDELGEDELGEDELGEDELGEDELGEDELGGATTLHAHSQEAAQEGFYAACKTAQRQRKAGMGEARYPHKRHFYRTTTWKNSGIRLRNGGLLLARAYGLEPLRVAFPSNLSIYPASAYRQVELVWDCAARHYAWHITLEDGYAPAPPPGECVVAVELGEIHPATRTDGKEAIVISARRLRATHQYTVKRLAELRSAQDHKHKHSRRWKRLQSRKNRFLAQQQRRARDIEHKGSRAVVDWAKGRQTGTLVVGDVRNRADGKRLGRKQQQKISLWSHGHQRQYLTYKAEAAGIRTVLINEHHISKTCPACGHQSKPRGRIYCCPACGFVGHRDAVGSASILSRYLHATRYRHPSLGRESVVAWTRRNWLARL